MTDVFRRIASIQSRFQVAAAAPVAKKPTDDFSAVLASTRATGSTSTTRGIGSDGRAGTSTSSGDTQASTIATLARSLGIVTGTGAMSLGTGTTATTSRAARDALGTATAAGTVPAAFTENRDAIARVATEEGVPASLLGALVWSESGFDPGAVSSAGARGLTQLMPATAEGLGVDIDDPADNLRGGARYLRQMLDRFGRADLALAAYNAGPNAVIRSGGVPPYQETQTYVTRVLARATTLAGGTP